MPAAPQPICASRRARAAARVPGALSPSLRQAIERQGSGGEAPRRTSAETLADPLEKRERRLTGMRERRGDCRREACTARRARGRAPTRARDRWKRPCRGPRRRRRGSPAASTRRKTSRISFSSPTARRSVRGRRDSRPRRPASRPRASPAGRRRSSPTSSRSTAVSVRCPRAIRYRADPALGFRGRQSAPQDRLPSRRSVPSRGRRRSARGSP